MRKKTLITCCLVAGLLSAGTPAFAEEAGPLAVAADAVIGRPVCFLATIVGSALFVVSLPIAATSHSVKKAAHELVVKPARATFTRPLGDFEGMSTY
jgi:hypothetical protein